MTTIKTIAISKYDSVSQHLVWVAVRSDKKVYEYKAYAVRGMSLAEYLANDEEIKNAAQFANGCFTFPDGSFLEQLFAHFLSYYADTVYFNS